MHLDLDLDLFCTHKSQSTDEIIYLSFMITTELFAVDRQCVPDNRIFAVVLYVPATAT